MADTPFPPPPPVVPTGSVPPNSPQAQTQANDEDDPVAAAAALSPAALLKKHSPEQPASPVLPLDSAAPLPTAPQSQTTPMTSSVSATGPLSEEPSQEELLHAAASPAQPLILPNRMQFTSLTQTPALGTAAGGTAFSSEAEKQKQLNENIKNINVGSRAATAQSVPVVEQLARPAEHRLTEAPAYPPIAISANKAALPAPPQPPAPPKAPAPPMTINPVKAASRSSVAPALFAVLIAILLLGGGVTVLAYTGTRVPFVAPMLSGLDNQLSQVAAQAGSFVQAQASYRFDGGLELIEIDQKETTMVDGTPVVYKLAVTTKEGIMSDRGDRFTAYHEVAANDTVAVPLAVRSTGTGGSWLVQFPANNDIFPATIPASQIPQTLLGTALRPVPLESVLESLQTEQEYQKITYSLADGTQISAAAYTASVKTEQLQPYFSTGAILENPTASTVFAWKGNAAVAGQPLEVQLKGKFTYQSRSYSYQYKWKYSGWGESVPMTSELKSLKEIDPSVTQTALNSDSFVARLGINPRGLPQNGVAGLQPIGIDEFMPIVPSGEVITAVQEKRFGSPVPTQPASDLAKQRDAQRKKDLADIKNALEQYWVDNGAYPDVDDEVQIASSDVVFDALVQRYLTKMPVDPLNTTYYYSYNVKRDTSGAITGYYLRSVLEDHFDPSALQGQQYFYYQVINN
jgi:hypothetical protein